MKEASEKMYHLVLSSGTPALENSIALTVLKTCITLLAYAVMSTHCHIALVCTCPDDFIKILKITYTKHFNSKYRRRGILFENDTYCRPVTGYLRQRVLLSYILRNPVHHGVAETAFRYPHSSIASYFRDGDNGILLPGISNSCSGHGRLKIKKGTGYVYYDLDENGRIPLRYFVNAGRTEYLYRTERSFIHQLNRWNTEDWEREQIKKYPQGEIITLTEAEPGFESEIEDMRAYERGAWRLRITDMEVCGYIDRVLLPEIGIPSYTMLDSGQLPSVINAVQRKFHVRDEQILRCLGLTTAPCQEGPENPLPIRLLSQRPCSATHLSHHCAGSSATIGRPFSSVTLAPTIPTLLFSCDTTCSYYEI